MWWWMFGALAAASTGRLEGVVTSPVDGRGLPNVDIVLRLESTEGAPHLAKTDRAGAFSFEDLPAGLYALDVVGRVPGVPAPGWVAARVSPVLVVPGATTTQQVVLSPVAAPPPAPPPTPRDT
jgi:hypothetical protein